MGWDTEFVRPSAHLCAYSVPSVVKPPSAIGYSQLATDHREHKGLTNHTVFSSSAPTGASCSPLPTAQGSSYHPRKLPAPTDAGCSPPRLPSNPQMEYLNTNHPGRHICYCRCRRSSRSRGRWRQALRTWPKPDRRSAYFDPGRNR